MLVLEGWSIRLVGDFKDANVKSLSLNIHGDVLDVVVALGIILLGALIVILALADCFLLWV